MTNIQKNYSYWDHFTEADIPFLERAAAGAALPVVLLVSLFGGGCSEQQEEIPQDKPLPFPDGGFDEDVNSSVAPIPTENDDAARDGGVAPPVTDGGVSDTTDAYGDSCVPSACLSEVIQSNGTSNVCQQFADISRTAGLLSPTPHQGAAIGDINSDGMPDVILLNQDGHHQAFQNLGGSFNEITDQAGLPVVDASKAILEDVTGDGTEDLVLVGSQGAYLYANENGRFEAYDRHEGVITQEASTSVAWMDGKLIVGTENGLRAYKRLSGRYVEASAEYGLIDPAQAYGLVVEDFNNDGRQDVFVANATGPNRLFRQKQDGSFESIENDVGLENVGASIDATWTSWNGKPALYVANYNAPNQFFIQENGQFNDHARDLGLQVLGNTVQIAPNGSWAEHPAFYLGRWDQENLFLVPQTQDENEFNHYREAGGDLHLNVSGQNVFSEWLDFNQDGKLDLLTVMADGGVHLFENQSHEMRTCP